MWRSQAHYESFLSKTCEIQASIVLLYFLHFFFFFAATRITFISWTRKATPPLGCCRRPPCVTLCTPKSAAPMCIRSFASFAPTDTRTRVCKQLRAGEAPTAGPQHVFPVSQSVYNSTTAGCHGGNPYELQMPRAGTNQGAAVTHHGPQVPPSATGTLLLFLPADLLSRLCSPARPYSNTKPHHHPSLVFHICRFRWNVRGCFKMTKDFSTVSTDGMVHDKIPPRTARPPGASP